jgi:hypothetical protein
LIGRSSSVNDLAARRSFSLDLLGTGSVKHGLDLLSVASGQRGVDEKEL